MNLSRFNHWWKYVSRIILATSSYILASRVLPPLLCMFSCHHRSYAYHGRSFSWPNVYYLPGLPLTLGMRGPKANKPIINLQSLWTPFFGHCCTLPRLLSIDCTKCFLLFLNNMSHLHTIASMMARDRILHFSSLAWPTPSWSPCPYGRPSHPSHLLRSQATFLIPYYEISG